MITGIKATTLTPFAYHSLMVPSGTATLPELIGDRAMAFAMAATLGMLNRSPALPAKDYRQHLAAMPFRSSVFTTDMPKLLPPLVRRLNLDAEAGLKKNIADAAKKGNMKDFFRTQEVPPYQVFFGAVFGMDPFVDGRKDLVVRIGLHRSGMVKLEKHNVQHVRLNAATSALFGRELPVHRYLLHYLQLTDEMTLNDAANEVGHWQ